MYEAFKGDENMTDCTQKTLLSATELADTEDFVITRFVEAVGEKITVSFEKGIKDSQGDIIRWEKI